MELKDRVRKVDISKMSAEQADEVSAQIGEKIRLMVDETVEKANAILSIYGMKAKMAIVIEGLPENSNSEPAPKAPSKSKKRKSNLNDIKPKTKS